jgi:oxygen-dependent protoporphyrinogen oxidase
VKGFLAQRKKVEEMRRKYPPKPGAKPRTFFTSFRRGLQSLTDSLADAAGRQHIRTGVGASSIERTADGCYRVTLTDGEVLEGDAVVLATEVWAAEPLARGVSGAVADMLAAIPCSSSATILIGLDEADCPFDKRWHGILSPSVEPEPVTGISLMSSKWPNRAPAGRVLLRGFVGGPRDQEIIEKGDEELVEIALSAFRKLLGVKAGAKPLFARVFRWRGGMPQYTLGHLDRVDALERLCGELPGLALAGGGYRGVGVPNCVDSGESAVRKVLGEWGITLAEDAGEQGRI